MLFIQWLYYRVECKYGIHKAFTRVGWSYGDDTTAHANHIKRLCKFAATLGIEMTVERSPTGTLMFLSDLMTPEGPICDIIRTLGKAYRFFSPFGPQEGFLYKLTGYYNPNKPIYNNETHLFKQAPVFSLFGKYAFIYMQQKLFKNSHLTFKEIMEKKLAILGDAHKYEVEDGHNWADYEEHFPGITKIHTKYQTLLSAIFDNKHELSFDKFKECFVKALQDIKPAESRTINLNPKKTFPVNDGIILQHGSVPISTDIEPQTQFLLFVFEQKCPMLSLALCARYVKFWKEIHEMTISGEFYKHYRAAAEKLIFKFTQLYKQLKQTNNDNKRNEKNKINSKTKSTNKTNFFLLREQQEKQTNGVILIGK
jgi:hypothetical protein